MPDQKKTSRRSNASFRNELRQTLGDTIRKPVNAILGYVDANNQSRVKVPAENADQPNLYYFTQVGGQSFVGQAYMREGLIPKQQIRYGTPIRVKKDVLNGAWEIIGLDVVYAAEFLDGIDEEDVSIIPLRRFEPGLLTPTVPTSMKAQVLAGYYDVGDDMVYIPTLTTVDWGSSPHNANMPPTGKAKFVLVEVDPSDSKLYYKYGINIPVGLTFEQAYFQQYEAGITTILPPKTKGRFRSGYIKLVNGMAKITRNANILAAQQILGSSSGGDVTESVLSRIVTDGVDVVVAGGEVVWIDVEE